MAISRFLWAPVFGRRGRAAEAGGLARPRLERNVVERARDVLDAVFVRPALVYGGEHAIWGSFFGPVLEAGEEGRGGGGGTGRLSGSRWKPGSRPGSRSRCTTWPMGFGAWLRSCRWFRGRASLSGV